MEEPIKVSKAVLEGLAFCRDSGKYNMFEFHNVHRLAFDNGYFETVDWMENNKNLYIRGIYQGFEEGEE